MLTRQRLLMTGITMAAATSFLLAANYCACEALTGSHPHSAGAHHHQQAAGHHHREDGHSSDGRADPCCSMLRAITTPSANLLVATFSPTLFRDCAAEVVQPIGWSALTHASTGLSPPARAPTPHLPFYRTTFAGRAPPSSCLA